MSNYRILYTKDGVARRMGVSAESCNEALESFDVWAEGMDEEIQFVRVFEQDEFGDWEEVV